MAEFDYRAPQTRFYARAVPSKSVGTIPMRIGVRIEGKHDICLGDNIRCVGWLNESKAQNNQYTFYVSGNPIKKQEHVDTTLTTIKKNVKQSLLHNLDEEKKTLAGALFWGDRGQGWESLSKKFRQAGMSHILAISGLHVGLVVLIATFMCTKNNTRPLLNMVTVFFVVLLIACVVELRAPIVRSIIMVATISTAKIFGFRYNNTGLLGVAAIVYLSCYPKGAETTAFQLTFLVVSSLFILLPKIQWRLLGPVDHNGRIKKLSTRFVALMWITGACAWCIASPITAHTFGTIAPSGLASSVPAILILTTTIFTGILKICEKTLFFSLEPLLNTSFSQSLDGLLFLTYLFGGLPLAFIKNISMSWTQSICAIVWFSCWSLFIRKRAIVWTTLPVLVLFLCVHPVPKNITTITTINVGHGTCHVIQHEAHTIMIDSGSRNNLDVGNRVVVPKLRSLRVKQIDTIIITHSDLDHLAGLIDIFSNYKVQKLVVAPQATQNPTSPLQKIFDEAIHKKIKIVAGTSGWTERFGKLKLSILSPNKHTKHISSNASSIVTTIQTNGRTLLFTGDIDEERITQLSQKNLQNIDVIELPHHGQWSHESQKLINTLLPKAVIQSTNTTRHSKDRWKIPHETARFVTSVDGDITTKITADGKLYIYGSNYPATMKTCVFIK